MTNFLTFFGFIVFCLININEACKCALRDPGIVFCTTDWTSHVKIIGKYTLNGDENSGGGFLFGGPNILYIVEQIKEYRKPENVSSLPVTIFTNQQSAACGITMLEVNKEYLLSGTYSKNLLYINYCSQMRGEDIDNYGPTPQEWGLITKNQRLKLDNGNYNNCTKNEVY
uniref:NTR domain-containing protein n=1 Tax=Parastrongyloides trichosuri TaxID=131310 RepID=A0A0N4Z103_PARTI